MSELIRFALAWFGLAVFTAALFHLLITARRRAKQRQQSDSPFPARGRCRHCGDLSLSCWELRPADEEEFGSC